MNSEQVSNCGQTATGRDVYDRWDACDETQLVTMTTHYLHLCAYTCVACNGPVISGSFTTRETEIQRETDISSRLDLFILRQALRFAADFTRGKSHCTYRMEAGGHCPKKYALNLEELLIP